MLSNILPIAVVASSLVALTGAQTFQRLGGCPTLGCILPPDQYVAVPLSPISFKTLSKLMRPKG